MKGRVEDACLSCTGVACGSELALLPGLSSCDWVLYARGHPERSLSRLWQAEHGVTYMHGYAERNCVVCLSPCEGIVELDCGHGCCAEGWFSYVESNVREGRVRLGCVGVGCEQQLTEEQIRTFIGGDEAVLEKYEYFLNLRRLEADPNVRWCINPRCGKPVYGYTTTRQAGGSFLRYAMYRLFSCTLEAAACLAYGMATAAVLRHCEAVFSSSPPLAASPSLAWTGEYSELVVFVLCTAASAAGMYRAVCASHIWDTHDEMKISTCESCGTQSCFDCKSALHPGKPCAHHVEHDIQAWVKDDTSTMRAPCHGCKSIIELRDGCNHITCVRCGYQFCMLCGEGIAGKVRHHYSKGGCTRYNGSMADAWKRGCWDFGGAPLKFTQNQVSQLSIPCLVAVGALMLNNLWGGLHHYSVLFCRPSTLVATATVCSLATWWFDPDHSPSLQRVLAPQLSSAGLGLVKYLLSYSAVYFDAVASEWTCLVLVTILVRMALLGWCTWATFKLALMPHTCGAATWDSAVGPSPLRPFLDLHIVANLYTAGFYGRQNVYDAMYASMLSLGMVFLGAVAFFSQTSQFGRGRRDATPHTALWAAYRRILLLGTAVFFIVFFDVTWSLRCVSYIACSAAALLTPTSLNKIPYHTALLGYVQRWQSEGKKGPLKKLGVVACAGLLVELAYIDGSHDGFFLTVIAHALVLNIAPLALLSIKHTTVVWWQQWRQERRSSLHTLE